jgi:hypothetical protein
MAKRGAETPIADSAPKKMKVETGLRTPRNAPVLELAMRSSTPSNRVTFEVIPDKELAEYEGKGAWDMIIERHVVIKNPSVPIPNIPLCRLMAMEAVRPLQEDDVETMKKEFRESGYIETHPAFYISIANKEGERASVGDFRDGWDDTWQELNAEFERKCDQVPEFRVLKDKMFWVFDGNHRLTAWSAVSREYPDSRSYHPCVRFVLLDPAPQEFVRVEQAMQKLNS